ncbi:hypothetical protein KGF56_000477 [Candida oxycetoniae]|uniref:FAD-binding FR-type domain-containing protein n=1 Tax=Candida oxycetoniae TaxID=497107 RepID=A0AAI9T1N4_9ASCO|nr:uncharacterized protein KGF56_000477 [Candida oxycetoniae]KAI3406631.1 hypothetical protein KGF56_000477 [Candida oxycetoniae]
MRILLIFIVSLTCLIAEKTPYRYTQLDIGFLACDKYITNNHPLCVPPEEWGARNYECYCKSDAAFATMMDCLVQGYNNKTKIITEFADACNMSIDAAYARYRAEITHNATSLSGSGGGSDGNDDGYHKFLTKRWGEITAEDLSSNPVLLNYDNGTFQVYKDSYEMNFKNTDRSIKYGAILLTYWGIIFLIAALSNLFSKVTQSRGRNSNRCSWRPLVNLYKKHLGMSSTFKSRNLRSFNFKFGRYHVPGGFIPTRVETIVLIVFLAILIVVTAVHIHHIDGNPLNASTKSELSALLGVRTIILTGYLVPLLVLFTGRNNILQWLTGLKFSTFLLYHRWIARIVVILIFIHAIAFTIVFKEAGIYKDRMATTRITWGIAALVCGGFILFFAILFFRRNWYQTFYVFHLLLATFFIIGAYRHAFPVGYGGYYWAAIAVWAFERVLRIVRLALFGIKTGHLMLMPDEILVLSVQKPKLWKANAGGYAFVHFLQWPYFWQAHPFDHNYICDTNELKFYIKVKNGITRQLYNKLVKCPSKAADIKIMCEGSYGGSSAGYRCGNMTYVASSTGIPALYSEIIDVDKWAPQNKTIKLKWIIRHFKSLAWFKKELKQLEGTRVEASVYVTNANDNLCELEDSFETTKRESDSNSEKESFNHHHHYSATCNNIIEEYKCELPQVDIVIGKPSMQAIVEYEAKFADSSIAFIGCGNPEMVDELRLAVRNSLSLTKYRMDYFGQVEKWS